MIKSQLLKNIKLQADLEAKYYDKLANNERLKELNITPAQFEYKNEQQALEDTENQRQIALKNIKTLLPKGNDAPTFYLKLSPSDIVDGLNEIQVFNRFFKPFSEFAGKLNNLTPTYLFQLWERFKAVADTYEEPKSNRNPADKDILTQLADDMGFQVKQAIKKKEASGQITPIQAEQMKREVEESTDQSNIPKLQELEHVSQPVLETKESERVNPLTQPLTKPLSPQESLSGETSSSFFTTPFTKSTITAHSPPLLESKIPSDEELGNYNKSQLQGVARDLDLPIRGTKEDIIKRIQAKRQTGSGLRSLRRKKEILTLERQAGNTSVQIPLELRKLNRMYYH